MNKETMLKVRETIGREYCETPKFKEEETELVRKAFAEISRVNAELFARIPYEVIFTEEDPYENAQEMRSRIQAEGKVYIFTGWSGHPYLTHEQNNISRAVHDIWAHCVCGCPFTFEGEYTAYLEQREYYPEWTWGVLFAEIPAQTCAYYYKGSFDYDQRAMEAPKKWMDMCIGLEKDFKCNSILESLLIK